MQTLTVDVFVSVDGWAGSENSPGYFGYFGPELEKWINAELAEPQLAIFGAVASHRQLGRARVDVDHRAVA